MTEEMRTILSLLAQHAEEATIHNEGWRYELEWRDGSCIVTQSKRFCVN